MHAQSPPDHVKTNIQPHPTPALCKPIIQDGVQPKMGTHPNTHRITSRTRARPKCPPTQDRTATKHTSTNHTQSADEAPLTPTSRGRQRTPHHSQYIPSKRLSFSIFLGEWCYSKRIHLVVITSRNTSSKSLVGKKATKIDYHI